MRGAVVDQGGREGGKGDEVGSICFQTRRGWGVRGRRFLPPCLPPSFFHGPSRFLDRCLESGPSLDLLLLMGTPQGMENQTPTPSSTPSTPSLVFFYAIICLFCQSVSQCTWKGTLSKVACLVQSPPPPPLSSPPFFFFMFFMFSRRTILGANPLQR